MGNNGFSQYDLTKLKEGVGELGIKLPEHQFEQFVQYYELLTEWNRFMNLTSITEFDEVCVKHFIDSLSLCKALDCARELSLIDIGTGAGFPGIPLKIAFPSLRVTLLDSLGKRVKFLDEVIRQLGLSQIDAVHGRAEDFAKPGLLREKFDICVSRAVANLSVLAEYCLPYVKVGGHFISYKSEKAAEELAAAEKAIDILGGRVKAQEKFTLPFSGRENGRTLIVIEKVGCTPVKYPRRSGMPSKNPL